MNHTVVNFNNWSMGIMFCAQHFFNFPLKDFDFLSICFLLLTAVSLSCSFLAAAKPLIAMNKVTINPNTG